MATKPNNPHHQRVHARDIELPARQPILSSIVERHFRHMRRGADGRDRVVSIDALQRMFSRMLAELDEGANAECAPLPRRRRSAASGKRRR